MADSTGNTAYPWLSELLCDYVDGAMEPRARALFEEHLKGSPDLAAHVQRLLETRQVLCAYGCRRLATPCNLHQRLHLRIAQEQAAATRPLPGRLGAASLLLAALVAALVGSTTLPEAGPREAAEVSALGVAFPAFYGERAALLPDTLPRSAPVLRIRATGGRAYAAP